MSVWQCSLPATLLCGSEGELVSVSISVHPRDLEGLLEALARVDFPINPQICHGDARTGEAISNVEFPAYAGGLEQVRATLVSAGFDPNIIVINGMLEKLQSLLDHEARRPGGNSSQAGDNPNHRKQHSSGDEIE
jgi:hypothetical protein